MNIHLSCPDCNCGLKIIKYGLLMKQHHYCESCGFLRPIDDFKNELWCQ
jgi:transposase-like protein